MTMPEKNITDEQAIIEHADRYACKDATLNMPISAFLLEDIKKAALKEGIENYQSWITMILDCAVAEAFALKEG